MRKRGSNIVVSFFLILMLVLSLSTTALADETEGKVVDKVTLEISNYTSYRVERPWIYINGEGCYAEGDISWEEDFKYLRSGETAHGVVTLRSNYGYYFDLSTRIHSKNNNLSATLDVINREEARLNVKYVTQKKLAYVEFKDYNRGDRYLKWKKVANADEYELSFFRAYDDEFYATFNVSDTKFDLNKIKRELSRDDKKEDLYCEIKALSDEGYLLDGETTRSTTLTLKFESTKDDETVYPTPNINKQRCTWIQKWDGSWYYTDQSGKNATGWQCINGYWYYLNPNDNGKMCTGWIYLDNKWYYLLPSGEMITGWIYLNNIWYYLLPSGEMATGWQNIGNKFYFFDNSGAMAHDRWINQFYVGSDGAWVR